MAEPVLAPLEAMAAEHLKRRAELGDVTTQWLERSEVYLSEAVQFFGPTRELVSIRRKDVRDWIVHLRSRRTARGAPMQAGTIRHRLHALSRLFQHAMDEERLPDGFNPLYRHRDKPKLRQVEAKWLEVHEAALFLEAARTLPRPAGSKLVPFLYPMIATYLLTGGRLDEVAGMLSEDVSFERGTVRFRSTPFRRGKKGKSRGADRVVPLWPQLREILGDYTLTRPPSQLLFPRWQGGQERPVSDLRGAFRAVERWAGLPEGVITSKVLRHTYCSARLQTLDRGQPVPLDTIRREMGHSNEDLIRRVYGHLGDTRHRAEAVEYRVEQHAEVLGDRLRRLHARADVVTIPVTTQGTNSLPRRAPATPSAEAVKG
jgi:integrase